MSHNKGIPSIRCASCNEDTPVGKGSWCRACSEQNNVRAGFRCWECADEPCPNCADRRANKKEASHAVAA